MPPPPGSAAPGSARPRPRGRRPAPAPGSGRGAARRARNTFCSGTACDVGGMSSAATSPTRATAPRITSSWPANTSSSASVTASRASRARCATSSRVMPRRVGGPVGGHVTVLQDGEMAGAAQRTADADGRGARGRAPATTGLRSELGGRQVRGRDAPGTRSVVPNPAAGPDTIGVSSAASAAPAVARAASPGGGGHVRREACGVSFLLRVVLPDKPGSLGAVATALGNAGADILGVDVVERGARPRRRRPRRRAARRAPAGRADHRGRVGARGGGRVGAARTPGRLETHRELELIEEITGDPGARAAAARRRRAADLPGRLGADRRARGRPRPTGSPRARPRRRRARATCRGCR